MSVSGHGSREDMRIMLETVNPRYLIPVHGETRHLHLHARLAQSHGMEAANVFIVDNGACWTSDGTKAWLGEPVVARDVYADGKLVGQIGNGVMRERERLSQDGFVAVYVPVNKKGRVVGDPRFVSSGFLPADAADDLMAAALTQLKRDLRRNGHNHHATVRDTLQTFFYRQTKSRPLIVPNIIQVQ